MTNSICPLVSVVVCAYNGEKSIKACLHSLVEQTAPSNRYEVLIIDDESRDKTFEIVSDFISRQKGNTLKMRLVRIRHSGLSIARNTGIFISQSEIIAYIDQDAVADKNWVSEILNAWDAVPDADAIGGQVSIRNIANQTAQFLFLVYYEPNERHAIIGTNMSFKKDRLLGVGAFGDPFSSRGDETFILNKMGSTRKEVKWPKAIVFHNWPVSIRQWMKERISNGEMHHLIFRILNDNKSLFKSFTLKRLIVMLLVVSMATVFSCKVLWVLLFVPGLFLLRGIKQGTYKICRKKYSLRKALASTLFWEMLREAGDWMFFLGRWRGGRMPFVRDHAMKGTVSDKHIITTIATW